MEHIKEILKRKMDKLIKQYDKDIHKGDDASKANSKTHRDR